MAAACSATTASSSTPALWRMHTGAQWREVPEPYGPWKTVYNRFARWRDDGTLDRVLATLRISLDDAGLIDHALGRSRGGWGTKLHLVVDGHGHPLAASLTAGQLYESRQAEPLLRMIRLGRRRRRPRRLAGDKGYSYPGVRAHLRRRGIRAVIPLRRDQFGKRSRPRGNRIDVHTT